MHTTSEACRKYLNHWTSSVLRRCSFACLALPRSIDTSPTAEELDGYLAELNKKLDFDGKLIAGKQIVSELSKEPKEEDFASTEEFEREYEAYWPKTFEAKPWIAGRDSLDVRRELLNAMNWSINNKSYKLINKLAEVSYVAYSRLEDEKREIAKQEQQHQALVVEFATTAAMLFTGAEPICLHRSNHQLEMHDDDSIAECYEGCFFDQTIVFTSSSNVLMIWLGYLRSYG